MSNYRLQLQFDKNTLHEIKQAKQRVMLAKPVNGEDPNVVWLSVDPFESTEIEWSEEYGIYVSSTGVQHGAAIRKISETEIPAQDGDLYELTDEATFRGPIDDDNVPRGSFAAHNKMHYEDYPSLTFGLTQTALINQKPAERKPISATPVIATQHAVMTPFTHVYIWLQAEFESETIITKISGDPTIVRFGGGVDEMSLTYQPKVGKFTTAN